MGSNEIQKQSNIPLECILLNLSHKELHHARTWINNLRDVEQERVKQTLYELNRTKFSLIQTAEGVKIPTNFAIIAAGTSIDTKDYEDIDLFLLSEYPLYIFNENTRTHPFSLLKMQIETLPEDVYLVRYLDKTTHPPKREFCEEKGAVVTVSLFYEMVGVDGVEGEGFRYRRPDHPDDLIEPEEPMSAEGIIQYNQKMNSKLVVLCKQYPRREFYKHKHKVKLTISMMFSPT